MLAVRTKRATDNRHRRHHQVRTANIYPPKIYPFKIPGTAAELSNAANLSRRRVAATQSAGEPITCDFGNAWVMPRSQHGDASQG